MIEGLFPEGVVTVTVTPGMEHAPLHPEEEVCVRRAVAKRRREFAAGRACARRALAELGIEDFPLINDKDRVPVWPAGVIGSITHCDGFSGAAVARSGSIIGIGLDAEPAEPLPVELVTQICTSAEIAWVRATAPPSSGSDWYKLIFSAKESVYKCCYPRWRCSIDFLDVELTLDDRTRSFGARFVTQRDLGLTKSTELAGRFVVTPKHIITAATLMG